MSFQSNGLIQKFLDLLGVQVETASGQYIAFMAGSAILALTIIALMLLLFRFLVFIRKG